MTHEGAFLSAIIESPDDDGPHLVYADWLEDHGQPERAAFIRVQIALARLPHQDPRREELEARERQLLEEHGEQWAGPLRDLVDKWEFRRGFVEEVTVGPEHFLAHAGAILALAPIRQAAFDGWAAAEATLTRLAACDALARLAAVGLYFGHSRECSDDTLRTLASLPPLLGRLDDLHIFGGSYSEVSEAGLAAVVPSPHLLRLRALAAIHCGLSGEAGVRPLVASRQLGRLEHLWLHTNDLGEGGVRALVAGLNCPSLVALGLTRCDAGPVGAAAIASSPHLAGLVALHLGHNAVGDEGAAALADSPHLDGLKVLMVKGNGITEAGIGRLRARFGDGVVA
jgi:uncharacterized protein (TIGR02996 family)